MVAINRDIFLRTLCLIAAFAYRTVQGARMGDVYLAANAVLFNLVTFMPTPSKVSPAPPRPWSGARVRGIKGRLSRRGAGLDPVGAGLRRRLHGGLRHGRRPHGRSPDQHARGPRRGLRGATLDDRHAAGLDLGYQFDGIFIGATRSVEMRNAMIVSLLVYLITTEAFRPKLGNHGIWLGFAVFMIARGLTLTYYPPPH